MHTLYIQFPLSRVVSEYYNEPELLSVPYNSDLHTWRALRSESHTIPTFSYIFSLIFNTGFEVLVPCTSGLLTCGGHG